MYRLMAPSDGKQMVGASANVGLLVKENQPEEGKLGKLTNANGYETGRNEDPEKREIIKGGIPDKKRVADKENVKKVDTNKTEKEIKEGNKNKNVKNNGEKKQNYGGYHKQNRACNHVVKREEEVEQIEENQKIKASGERAIINKSEAIFIENTPKSPNVSESNVDTSKIQVEKGVQPGDIEQNKGEQTTKRIEENVEVDMLQDKPLQIIYPQDDQGTTDGSNHHFLLEDQVENIEEHSDKASLIEMRDIFEDENMDKNITSISQ
ncbi:hypothetical protein K7X08_030616 [Anisodus acutangulus]|uniref:Uncharacterized protein n=1 Tax=Anisodus acutangulus TaxID=402998 RepID=A0A9Q1L7A2_9SOLA|nr:hypothetical protein K7X08_030616 [Anisodus acutangulus]